MPFLPSYSPSNLRSIHLLRALLREASYLPDIHARQYFRRYIVNRFKAYQPARNATASADISALERRRQGGFKKRHVSIIQGRAAAMQQKAQKGLNYLRRANSGELLCLEKVLQFTYGRVGRRRYALLEHLHAPDLATAGSGGPVFADDEPAPLQKLYYSNQRYLAFFDAPKHVSDSQISVQISDRYARMKAVLKSQASHGISLNRGIKRDTLTAPAKNAWERPMPVKRARNIIRRWYAETLSRLLPPLPSDEWDRLKALSDGSVKWNDSVPRRTRAIELAPESSESHSQAKRILHEGLLASRPSYADRPGGLQRPHNVTPRMMRRLYAKILALSCKLDWNEERQKWTVRWGSLRETHPAVYAVPVAEELFAGADNKGRRTTKDV